MMAIEISKDETEGKITLPGYSFSDLNRAALGNFRQYVDVFTTTRRAAWKHGLLNMNDRLRQEDVINPWSVATMGEMARWSFYHNQHPEGLQVARYKELANNRLIFMVAAKYNIMPAFYKKSSHIYNPVSLQFSLGGLGKSSFQLLDETTSLLSNEILHRTAMTQVMVDKETRKPIPLPDWYREKFDCIERKTDPWTRYAPTDPPADGFKFEYKPVWSDTDYYYHVNHASYIRICMDALSEAAALGKLNCAGSEDLGPLHVREMRMMYVAESFPGVPMEVTAWEDPGDTATAHCIMTSQEQTVFRLTVTFYQS